MSILSESKRAALIECDAQKTKIVNVIEDTAELSHIGVPHSPSLPIHEVLTSSPFCLFDELFDSSKDDGVASSKSDFHTPDLFQCDKKDVAFSLLQPLTRNSMDSNLSYVTPLNTSSSSSMSYVCSTETSPLELNKSQTLSNCLTLSGNEMSGDSFLDQKNDCVLPFNGPSCVLQQANHLSSQPLEQIQYPQLDFLLPTNDLLPENNLSHSVNGTVSHVSSTDTNALTLTNSVNTPIYYGYNSQHPVRTFFPPYESSLLTTRPSKGKSEPKNEFPSSQPSNQSAQNHTDDFSRKRFCLVCGDTAVNQNFGRLTCESCKAFFRRNAFKDGVLRCIYGKQCCGISIANRKQCPACRLLKCFQVGMDRSLIQIRKNAIVRPVNAQFSTSEDCCSSKKRGNMPASSSTSYISTNSRLQKSARQKRCQSDCSEVMDSVKRQRSQSNVQLLPEHNPPPNTSSMSGGLPPSNKTHHLANISSDGINFPSPYNSTSINMDSAASPVHPTTHWHWLFQKHFRNACFFNVAKVPMRLDFTASTWPLDWCNLADIFLRPVHDMILDMTHLEDMPSPILRSLIQKRLLYTLPIMQAACSYDWKGLCRVRSICHTSNVPSTTPTPDVSEDVHILFELDDGFTYTQSLRTQGHALSSFFSPTTQVFTRLGSYCRNLAHVLNYQPALFLLCFLLKLFDLPEFPKLSQCFDKDGMPQMTDKTYSLVYRKRTELLHLFQNALQRLQFVDYEERLRVMLQMLEWSRIHFDPFLHYAFSRIAHSWGSHHLTPFMWQLCSTQMTEDNACTYTENMNCEAMMHSNIPPGVHHQGIFPNDFGFVCNNSLQQHDSSSMLLRETCSDFADVSTVSGVSTVHY